METYKIVQKRLPLREQWILNYVNFLACILLPSDWFKNNQLLSKLTHAHYRDTVNWQLSKWNMCRPLSDHKQPGLKYTIWHFAPINPPLQPGHFNHFELLVGKLDAIEREYFLVGDLSCNMISEIRNNDTRLLTNITDIYGLHQLINEPRT